MYCFYSLVPRPHQHITWKGALVTIDTFLSPTYIDLEIEIPIRSHNDRSTFTCVRSALFLVGVGPYASHSTRRDGWIQWIWRWTRICIISCTFPLMSVTVGYETILLVT